MRPANTHPGIFALPALLCLLCILCISCGGSDGPLPDSKIEPVKTEHAPLQELRPGSVQPGLPGLAELAASGNAEVPRELSYTNVVHYAGNGIFDGSPGNLFPDGSTVVVSDSGTFGWVTYAFNTGGYQPEVLSLDITCNPGSSAYIAWGDFGSGRWAFQQPVTGPVTFQLPAGLYLNSTNQFFVAVVTYGGSLATVNSINIEFDNDLVYPHSISGTILDEHGEPMPGQSLSITPNPDSVQVVTGTDGGYTIGLPAAGMYDVTPQSTNTGYSPVMQTVDVNGDMTGVDFTGTRLDIRGRIADADGNPLAGVQLTLSPGNAITFSGADGEYHYVVQTDDSYTVTPLLATYAFTPSSAIANVSGADVDNLDFSYSGGQPTYGIFGNVHEADLSPVDGVFVTLNPGNRLAITDANGNYGFTGLAEATYDLACSKNGWSFAPPVKLVNISGSSENGADFTGTPPLPTRKVSGTSKWRDPETNDLYGIPGLLVRLKGIDGNTASYGTETDINGDYEFPAVVQGRYKLDFVSISYNIGSATFTIKDSDGGASFFSPMTTGGPTWQNFAASYVGNQCTSCHRPGSQTAAAPFLRDYDEVVNAGTASHIRIQNDTMPPGNPSLPIHKRQFELWRLANYPLDDYPDV